MRIKICGVTNLEDALVIADAGADAIGFVFYPASPRVIQPKEVREIIRHLPPYITTVGVLADQEEEAESIIETCGLDLVQFQGNESPKVCERLGARVVKAIRVKDRSSLDQMKNYQVRAYVLDAYRKDQLGGTGETFDWGLAIEAKKFGRIILAGGLGPDNVTEAIRRVKPMGVDVSSGVEEKLGKKSPKKVRQFIQAARSAFDHLEYSNIQS